MKSQVAEQHDFLPGYHAVERLGSGGYGEVWKAEAPGGLVKAVKLIHGFSHEQRANDELKAMERVKQVRHPFLLSLERIEIIDDRLLIVTELADQSLKDYFNDCLRRGKSGLPRSELLNYLRDAADALDFMSEVHGLQHLDIKPENLLLVAGHVKVADFGLVKDVQRSCVSLVGGLTPVYAAPEVFQGRPSRYSDQYSLAVVFQQMLTATLPFSGASAAELTLQHLSEEPDLLSLPPGDRPTIARALSKNPEHRFASCRTMVDALLEGEAACASSDVRSAGNRAAQTGRDSPEIDTSRGREHSTGGLSEEDVTAPSPFNVTLKFASLPSPQVKVREAPPFNAEGFQAAPTLVVGIGGSAGHVLRSFKRRIADRFGEAEPAPALATLLVDTDSSDLLQATHGTGSARLAQQETLAVPLRRPQDYRNRHGQPFRWLSRRWLYNVPRSLKTEGLRPLGRLAFVDHAGAIRARLRAALDQILAQPSIEQTTELTGLPFAKDRLRVYLVSSICGGTGSGMALDVAYMLRSLIEERDVECEGVTGVLVLQTPQQPRMRDLAAVNAFAWLTEYNHFNRAGAAFPGDPSCGLPPREIDDKAFRTAYVVHLGAGEATSEAEGGAADVAEYLYLDALTPVGSFFDGCRHAAASDPADDRAPLATFGVALRDASRNREVEHVITELVQKVILGWLGRIDESNREIPVSAGQDSPSDVPISQPHAPDRVERDCAKEAQTLQLDCSQLLMLSGKLLERELRATPRSFFQRLVLELRGSRDSVDALAVVQAVDRMFGGSPTTQDRAEGMQVLRKPLEDITRPLAEKMAQHLANWLYGRFDAPEHRLRGALEATEWFIAHLRETARELASRDAQILRQIEQPLTSEETSSSQGIASEEGAFVYFRQRFDRAVTAAAQVITGSLIHAATHVRNQLAAADRSVRDLADQHQKSRLTVADRSREEHEGCADEMRRQLAEAVVAHEYQWISAINTSVRQRFAGQAGGLYRALCGGPGARVELLSALDDAARRCVRGAVAETNLLDRLLGSRDDAIRRATDTLLHEAHPPCLEYGGTLCHVLASPHDANIRDAQGRISKMGDVPMAVVQHPENQLAICTEAHNVSLIHLAMALIRSRRDYASFAERVLSRKDVPWSPLMVEPPPALPEDPAMQTVVL